MKFRNESSSIYFDFRIDACIVVKKNTEVHVIVIIFRLYTFIEFYNFSLLNKETGV